jgi:hypothetical protein
VSGSRRIGKRLRIANRVVRSPFIPSVIVRLHVGPEATQQRLVARMGGWVTTSGDTAMLRAHKLEVACSLSSMPAR